MSAPALSQQTAVRDRGVVCIMKKAVVSALLALVLVSLMIGIRTESGPSGQLTYWTRFGELAIAVGAVFLGSIIVETLRCWIGPVGSVELPTTVRRTFSMLGRLWTPALLIFALLVPVIFYNQRYLLDLGILVLTHVMLG